MRLYEFTYTDNQNLAESELLHRVGEFLSNESDFQGWAPEYKFRLCRQVEQLPDGSKNYYFEVIGAYLSDENLDGENEISESSSETRTAVAAPDINP